jgi:hypothetical protein
LILAGVLSLLAGRFPHLGIGRLPGDIIIKRDNFTFYFPLLTCILISLVLTGIFWLVSYFTRR